MAKDPAFLFYPGDWQGGTMILSRFIKGCYMDLLIAQFNNGHLSLEEIRAVLGGDFQAAWPTLSKKFAIDKDGNFFNVKLEAEILKRQKFSKEQSDRVTKRWNDVRNNHGNTAVLPKKENEDENVNEDQDKGLPRKKGFVKPSKEQLQDYFNIIGVNGTAYERFFDHYESNGWKVGKNNMKSWEAAARNWVKNSGKYDPPGKNNGLSTYEGLL